MRRERTIMLGGLACLTAVLASVLVQIAGLDSAVRASIRQHEATMQTLTEDVVRKDGRITKVTTTRGTDESILDFIARHDAVVAALKNS